MPWQVSGDAFSLHALDILGKTKWYFPKHVIYEYLVVIMCITARDLKSPRDLGTFKTEWFLNRTETINTETSGPPIK
jgi:hypothetical protein